MIKTELTREEAEKMAGRIAELAMRWNVPAAATFLFEAHRPVAPITGHLLIGFGTMLNMLLPFDAGDLGLFLLEDGNTLMLEKKIKELAGDGQKREKT